MGEKTKDTLPTGRDIFQASDSGAGDRPFIPRLRSDAPLRRPPRSLEEFRANEGRETRKRRLKELWAQLPVLHTNRPPRAVADTSLDSESAQRLVKQYENELLRKCGGHTSSTSTMTGIGWKEFVHYAEAKEQGACSHRFDNVIVLTVRRALASFPRRTGFGRQRTSRRAGADSCSG